MLPKTVVIKKLNTKSMKKQDSLLSQSTPVKLFDSGKPMSSALSQAMSHVKEFMTDSQKSMVLLREGKLFMDSGDYRGAIECFNEGISFNPSVTLFNMKASCHKSLEMFSEAYFDYSYTIRLEPEVGSHYCSRGLCLAKLKKVSMALEDLDVAIELDPSTTHFYSRAITFAEFGKYELAIDDYTAAIGEDSSVATLNSDMKLKCKYKRSLANFELQRFDEVVQDCTAVLHQDPNNVATRALLGRALKILNEHKKAEEQLTFAILLDDTQAALYTERGDIRFRTAQKNKIIEAIYDFDKAVKLLEAKLATRYLGGDPLNSARISHGKLGRSPSFSVQIPPVTVNKFNLASGPGDVLVSSPLNKIDESGHLDEDEAGSPQQKDPFSSKLVAPLTGTNKTAFLRSGSVSSNLSNPASQANAGGVSQSSAYFKEVEEQLADTLFKRAQAKLMIEINTVNIESALSDAIKSSAYQPEDDDYQMVIATCNIRLNRYTDALRVLELILERSPTNHKALYNYSFCQRASGLQKDAIEGLTKIISCSQPNSMTGSSLSIPIHRVYEMRGTLLHEMQAHKLALSDLGKAIAINPSHSDNYYLRGDCQCKLGNYEQALRDFDLAESKHFEDMGSLHIARGGTRRLLGDSVGAGVDFHHAYLLLDKNDKIGRVRVLSFKAFCQIDQQLFQTAHDSLVVALTFAKELVAEKISSNSLDYAKVDAIIHKHITDKSDSWIDRKRKNLVQLTPTEADILYLKRIEWILQYHSALCLYMQQNFREAEEVLLICISEDSRKFVSDNLSLGTQLYFLAVAQMQLSKFPQAETHLAECAQTHWIDSQANRFLHLYSSAKLSQCQGRHHAAVTSFTEAMKLRPNDPHCHFKRAWSYKALGDFVRAGEDFEQAKRLRPDDPNFSVDYRRISQFEYMVVGSEPDLVHPFPALLPVPGLAAH